MTSDKVNTKNEKGDFSKTPCKLNVIRNLNLAGLKFKSALVSKLRQSFYARKQNASRVFAIVWASVCLSVCPSVCHTRDLYQNGAS